MIQLLVILIHHSKLNKQFDLNKVLKIKKK